MNRKIRGAIMVATALAAAGSILWMQGRYEASDQRHALEVVETYHPEGGTTIPALIEVRHPGKPVAWSTAVENSCYQHIRVHAVVTDDPAKEPVLYAFVVDINGPAIHPANENGKELIAALDQPLPAPAAASSASSTAAPSASSTAAPSASSTAAPSSTAP